MTAEEAIIKLKARNQAFVNRQGKTTPYSRDTDEIISALVFEVEHNRLDEAFVYRTIAFGKVLGIPNLADRLNVIRDEVFTLIKNGCKSFRHYGFNGWPIEDEEHAIPFDFEHPAALIKQLVEASDTWERKYEVICRENAFDRQQMELIEDPLTRQLLEQQIQERGNLPKDLL